jgi:tripartite ATP-independent transporter DctP family solute receptor
MKKAFWIIALSALLVITGSPAIAAMNLKIGLPAPPSHPHTQSLQLFADYVKDKTNGEITIDVFPMSQLGGERSMTEQVQGGTLDMADITTAVLSNFVPQVAMLDLPFIWPSRGLAYTVLNDTEFKRVIFDLFPQKGMVALGYGENEIRDMTNIKLEVRKPEDVKGLKIRVMEAPVYLDTWRTLGASPVPMPFAEVYNAMQQGVIDAQENPIMTSVLMKFTEVSKYATILQYSLTATIKIINIDVWNRLTPDQQEILMQGAALATQAGREGSMKLSHQLVQQLQTEGKVKITRLTPEERDAFQKAVQPMYVDYDKKLGKIPNKEAYGRFAGMSYLKMLQEKVNQYQ